MVDLLTQLVLFLFKKSTGGSAKVTQTGISGRIGLPIGILSLIPTGLLIALGCLAVKDPDPEDKMAGYLVIVIAGIFVLLSLHWFTYRIYTNNHLLIAGSLLMKDRVIDLDQPFSLEEKDDGILILLQNRRKIRVSWNVKGHHDFSNVVRTAYDDLKNK